MNEKNSPLFTRWKIGNERSRIASCSSFLCGTGNGLRNDAFFPPDARYRKSATRGTG